MNADLDPIVAALTDLSDRELDALIATVNDCPQFAPGLLAWMRVLPAHVTHDLKHPVERIARVVGVDPGLRLQFFDAALVYAVDD